MLPARESDSPFDVLWIDYARFLGLLKILFDESVKIFS